jgi:hypothetical protein
VTESIIFKQQLQTSLGLHQRRWLRQQRAKHTGSSRSSSRSSSDDRPHNASRGKDKWQRAAAAGAMWPRDAAQMQQ